MEYIWQQTTWNGLLDLSPCYSVLARSNHKRRTVSQVNVSISSTSATSTTSASATKRRRTRSLTTCLSSCLRTTTSAATRLPLTSCAIVLEDLPHSNSNLSLSLNEKKDDSDGNNDDDDDDSETCATYLEEDESMSCSSSSSSSPCLSVRFATPLVTTVHVYERTTTNVNDLFYSQADFVQFRREALAWRKRQLALDYNRRSLRRVSFATTLQVHEYANDLNVKKSDLYYSEGELQQFLDDFCASLHGVLQQQQEQES